MLGVKSRSASSYGPSNHYLDSPSCSVGEIGMFNMSPTLSVHSDSIVDSEGTFPYQASLNLDSVKVFGYDHVISSMSECTPTPKSSMALRKEIAQLEVEIMHSERYLLSLYRTAFVKHLPSDALQSSNQNRGISQSLVAEIPSRCKSQVVKRGGFVEKTSPRVIRHLSNNEKPASIKQVNSTKDEKYSYSGHQSLADLLGGCCGDSKFNSPETLSEDIVRCISSIYCKLANSPSIDSAILASPISSLSSSSIFSSNNHADNHSTNCIEDPTEHEHEVLKERNGPYCETIEISKISLDEAGFNFATTALQKFRSLVHKLEKVDPRKMNREEKLAFWINIHNALVMHAYLAYGSRSSGKNSSILKAVYNVGGHCVNAYTIQSSILKIRSHYSAPRLHMLFSSGKKLKPGSIGHDYALDYPEPLVHFALCSRAYYDPVVRVYKAKTIFHDLKLAKRAYIQANVHIGKEKKILLPRIVYLFAKDMLLDMPRLLNIISECLTQVQQEAMKKRIKGRLENFIDWLPQNPSFRCIIDGKLAN